MNKAYLSPKLELVLWDIDAIMDSLGTSTNELGDGDWGVQDEF